MPRRLLQLANEMAGWGYYGMRRGYSRLRGNVGYGFRALKANPSLVMGFGQPRAAARQGKRLRPRNLFTLGPQVARTMGRWGAASDLAGTGGLRRTAVAARMGTAAGVTSAADYINPWGLGWGD